MPSHGAMHGWWSALGGSAVVSVRGIGFRQDGREPAPSALEGSV